MRIWRRNKRWWSQTGPREVGGSQSLSQRTTRKRRKRKRIEMMRQHRPGEEEARRRPRLRLQRRLLGRQDEVGFASRLLVLMLDDVVEYDGQRRERKKRTLC
jgi:hypothetical protein